MTDERNRVDWRAIAAILGLMAIAVIPFFDLPPAASLTIILATASAIFAASLILSVIDGRKKTDTGTIQGKREAGGPGGEAEAKREPLPDPIEHGFDSPI